MLLLQQFVNIYGLILKSENGIIIIIENTDNLLYSDPAVVADVRTTDRRIRWAGDSPKY